MVRHGRLFTARLPTQHGRLVHLSSSNPSFILQTLLFSALKVHHLCFDSICVILISDRFDSSPRDVSAIAVDQPPVVVAH